MGKGEALKIRADSKGHVHVDILAMRQISVLNTIVQIVTGGVDQSYSYLIVDFRYVIDGVNSIEHIIFQGYKRAGVEVSSRGESQVKHIGFIIVSNPHTPQIEQVNNGFGRILNDYQAAVVVFMRFTADSFIDRYKRGNSH